MVYFKERRSSIRLKKHIHCSIVMPNDNMIAATFENISNNSAYLQLSQKISLPVATKINLSLQHGYFSQPLSAIITRRLPDGIAIEFDGRQSRRRICEFHQSLTNSGCKTCSTFLTLSLDKVSRQWGDNIALQNIDLRFHQKEIVALIGPSGSGKSTLFKLLSGVTKPSSGEVTANGHSLAALTLEQLRKYRSQFGVIQQKHLLVAQNTVHQNVISGLVADWPFYKIVAAAVWNIKAQHVNEILDNLGIAEFQWHLASQLSVGQQQRVAVARALISNPNIILADEPTAALDPVTAMAVTRYIIEHTEQQQCLLIFCTHNLELIKVHCTRVIGLRDGQVLFDTQPTKINDEIVSNLYQGSHEKH